MPQEIENINTKHNSAIYNKLQKEIEIIKLTFIKAGRNLRMTSIIIIMLPEKGICTVCPSI